MTITINCDMGESFSIYTCGDDEGLMPFIQLANVACGFHASDPVVMQRTVALAKTQGVKVGAHPSFPDLAGFGRREIKMSREELRASIIYQVGALKAFVEAAGVPLNHIKPHGALFGAASRSEEVAQAIADAVEVFNVPVVGMPNTLHEKVYTERGLTFLAEYYADLEYDDEGGLIISRTHEAVDPDRTLEKCLRVIRQGQATTVSGKVIPMRGDTICVHSDTPGAVALAQTLHDGLKQYLG